MWPAASRTEPLPATTALPRPDAYRRPADPPPIPVACRRRGPKGRGKGPKPCKTQGRGKHAKEIGARAKPASFYELSPMLTAQHKAGNLSMKDNPNGAIMRGYYATRGR